MNIIPVAGHKISFIATLLSLFVSLKAQPLRHPFDTCSIAAVMDTVIAKCMLGATKREFDRPVYMLHILSFSSSTIACNSFSLGKLTKYLDTNTFCGKPIVVYFTNASFFPEQRIIPTGRLSVSSLSFSLK